jgi:tetratricopeptide (TPR) repeat protein
MLKKLVLLLLLGSIGLTSKAQVTDTLFNRLGDFDLDRFNNKTSEAIQKGEQILPDSGKLPPKTRISFFGRMAKLYEDDGQDTKAVFYYEKVVAAIPDYFVARRALGYLYDKNADEIHLKLFQLKPDDPVYDKLFATYQTAVRKALPHLEKAQACDPTDGTLDLIKTLYKNIHDEPGLNSLDERLKDLSKNCIDILSEN